MEHRLTASSRSIVIYARRECRALALSRRYLAGSAVQPNLGTLSKTNHARMPLEERALALIALREKVQKQVRPDAQRRARSLHSTANSSRWIEFATGRVKRTEGGNAWTPPILVAE